MSAADADLRPARLSGALATLFALAAVAALASDAVTPALGVEVAGLCVLAAGLWLVRADWRVLGTLVGLGGLGTVAGSMGMVWVVTGDPLSTVQVVPGMLGVLVLALGVIPARGGGSRRLVKAGTGVVLLGGFVAAIVQRPRLTTLLLGGAATVLAWDAGENAIGVGAQLGRRASTRWIEVAHLAGTALVALLAVAAARTVRGIGTVGLPLTALALLLVAVLLLALALHD